MKTQLNELKRMQQLAGLLKEELEQSIFQADYTDGIELLVAEIYGYVEENFTREDDIDNILMNFEEEEEKYKMIWDELPQNFTITPSPDQGVKPMHITKTENGFTTDYWDDEN
jgi:hypothetical protein